MSQREVRAYETLRQISDIASNAHGDGQNLAGRSERERHDDLMNALLDIGRLARERETDLYGKVTLRNDR